MTDLDDRVLTEATERGTLSTSELLSLCERYDGDDGPGVPRDTLLAYARELADATERVTLRTRSERLDDQDEYAITDGLLVQELEARLASEANAGSRGSDGDEKDLFEVGGEDDRVSAYPPAWHEAIGGERDIGEVFRFLEEAEPFRRDAEAGTGKVNADRVVAVASAVGDLDPEKARERLSDLEREGKIVEASESPDHRGLRSREGGGEEGDLPPALDFRNALDEIDARSDTDVSEDTDAIRAGLEDFTERDAGRESLLSDIDRLTVDIESQVSGKAARRAEGIRNQIDAYRERDGDETSELSFSGPSLADREGNEADIGAADGVTTLRGTLVNGGDERGVVATCTFYGESEAALRTVESRVYELGAGEKRDVEIDLFVPAEATRYAAVALDASGTRAIGDAKPER